MKILVVGRTLTELDPLRRQLEGAGYEVDSVADRLRVGAAAAAGQPDLLLLEPAWPLLEGLDVCRSAQHAMGDMGTPVLVMGSSRERIDLVAALENGADEFVDRPYDSRELIARIRALLRRAAHGGGQVLKANGIELDTGRHTVCVHGRPVRLTAKEFELLKLLLEARGRVVERETAMERIWRYRRNAGIMSRTLDVHVRKLRRKLGEAGGRIITVRNVGYRMEVSREWIEFAR